MIKNMELNYKVEHRGVKYPRLELKTGTLLIVLPRNYKDEVALIKKHEKWLYKKELVIRTALKDAKNKNLNLNRTREELKCLVYSIAENLQNQLNFKVNNIYFRKMNSKWGSCSSKRNLTVNTVLKYLPEELIEYVVLHEMAHILERRHNERFWSIVGEKFKDYRTKERNLLAYWFLVQEMLTGPSYELIV